MTTYYNAVTIENHREDGYVYDIMGTYVPFVGLSSSTDTPRSPMKHLSFSRPQEAPPGPRPKAAKRAAQARPTLEPLHIDHTPSSMHPTSSVWDNDSNIFHYFGLDIDIDPSCLEALDDKLLFYPVDSFADLCWEEAVEDDGTVVFRRIRSYTADSDSDSSDDDDGTLRTVDFETTHVFSSKDLQAEFEWPQDLISSESGGYYFRPSIVEHRISFMQFEPHFSRQNPNDSVHFAPVSPQKSRRNESSIRRIAIACAAGLPMRLRRE